MSQNNQQSLLEKFDAVSGMGLLNRTIPDFVLGNLNPVFSVRKYQIEAMARTKFYFENYPDRNIPAYLLFHMATGSGKTLLMASNILYLYEKGYRNFVFFVNSTSIIKKTKINFLDKSSHKYLFADKIIFNDKEVRIEEVNNFEGVNSDSINILFTTVQGLHSTLNEPQENAITYESFCNGKTVFLSDEAHHINTLTKRKKQLTKEEEEESNSWEYTVNKVFNGNPENIMLEYTATVELGHDEVRKKYFDKIIFQYTLKEFRQDGFSKEVQILQSDLSIMERALQAVILSQYRRKVAEKYKIALKPVILLKSRQIKDSEAFEQLFYTKIKELSIVDIKTIHSNNADGVIKQAFDFFKENQITDSNLVKELKEDFAPEKCIIVNSKADSEEKQILLNSLEKNNNEIRVVFTTNMLNEGWDVLNLFDIVRLYETRDAKNGKSGQTTISEAQLIGRGARYYPFHTIEEQNKFVRKYDDDIENELRVLEQLYYHSLNDSRYIAEIKNELINQGIRPPDDKIKILPLKIKGEIENSKFWKEGLIFLNEKVKNDNAKIKSLSELITKNIFRHHLRSGDVKETSIFSNKKTSENTAVLKMKKIKIGSIEKHIIRKGLDRLDFYKFNNLNRYLPKLNSLSEFIESDLAKLDVEVEGKETRLDNLNNKDKYDLCVQVFKDIAGMIQANTPDFVGSKVFKAYKIATQAKSKTLEIIIDGEKGIPMSKSLNPALCLDVSEEDWYIHEENYGTSEEKYFVRFIKNLVDELKSKYRDVYLLRNENYFKIYRFSDARAIEPDFVLFMKEKDSKKTMSYQLFVEPKGNHLLQEDVWKEEFLRDIEKEFKIDTLFEDGKYRIIGLPFYNEQLKKQDFEKVFREKLLV